MVKMEVSGPMMFNYSTGELEPMAKAPRLERGHKIYAYGYAMSCQLFAVVNPDTCEMVEVDKTGDVDEYSLDRYFSPTSRYDSYIRPVSKKFGIGFYYAENEPLFSEEVIEESLKRAELVYKMRDEREKAAEEKSRKNKAELLRKYDFLTPGTDYKTASGNLRTLLKREFPGVKFSVRKSGGYAVYISWTDGPTREMVDGVAGMFKGRSFNGMEDYEEIITSDFTDLFGSLGYIFTEREFSEDVIERESKKVVEDYPILADGKEHHRNEMEDIKESEANMDYWFSLNSVVRHRLWDIDLTEKTAEPSRANETVEPVDGLQIIDYSEKAVAVIGETRAVKDKLKELGGRFNAKLSCGPGWIFSKSKKDALKSAFNI